MAIKDERPDPNTPAGRVDERLRKQRKSRRDGGLGRKRTNWVYSLEGLLVALCLALTIRAFFVQAFKIPSGSMKDSLLVGDFLLVSKFTYWFTPPQRGDVVVFREASQKENFTALDWFDEMWQNQAFDKPSTRRDLVKRMVGLPGDILEVREGLVYINGNPLDEPYVKAGSYKPENDHPIVPATLTPDSYSMKNGAIYVHFDARTLAAVPALEAWRAEKVDEFKKMASEKRVAAKIKHSSGKSEDLILANRMFREAEQFESQASYLSRPFEVNLHRLGGVALESVDRLPPLTIPEGYCFVMGDNRDHSADSRYFGFLPMSYIRGKAAVIYFSMAPSVCRDDDETDNMLGARCSAELDLATASDIEAGKGKIYSDTNPADRYWVCKNPECEYKGTVYRDYWDKIGVAPSERLQTGIPLVDPIGNFLIRLVRTTRWDRIGRVIITPGPTKFLND